MSLKAASKVGAIILEWNSGYAFWITNCSFVMVPTRTPFIILFNRRRLRSGISHNGKIVFKYFRFIN